MVGPELGRETDAIAESVLLIIRSAWKVVRPKPDQLDRRRRHCMLPVHVHASVVSLSGAKV